MAYSLDQEIKSIKGVGPAKVKDFERLDVKTLKDILYSFPFRYDDLSKKLSIADVKPGEKVTINGTISIIKNRKSQKNKRMIVTEAVIEDGTGSIKAVWFHQGFLTKVLKTGKTVSLSGKVDDQYGLSIVNPTYEVISHARTPQHTGRIVPIYKLTGSITQKFRRKMIEHALGALEEIQEWMPEPIMQTERLMPIQKAINFMHLPDSLDHQKQALERLKFNEFFLHQLLHGRSRRELQKMKASIIPFNEKAVQDAVKSLPFELTEAQKKTIWLIIKDMSRDQPMNRLLEGDVGTGKTLVAAISSVNAAASGWQTAMLAPTEILAEQHFNTLNEQFGDIMKIAVFTRTKRKVGGKEVTKKQMLDALKNGKVDFVVGTHALLSKDVCFNRLGFIIVDEQHRFGVKQRKALKDREGDADGIPHLLSMTATPIPRSLALVLYGDLDRSVLDEYPAGRQPIDTFIVQYGKEENYYERMREEMDAGRQVFVVCPLIEESDALGVNSVEEVYRDFSQGPFQAYNVAVLHGRMKPAERDEVMKDFASGAIDMVISTTVVEVGVDVPNATVMFIEGAERFGLAQLHQLRGRVGRGKHKSYCFLHPSEKLSGVAKERLAAVVKTQNGFVLADKDLSLRGPGNIFGTEQSGFEVFKLGSFADIDLISKARDYAKDYLDEDPELDTWPELKKRVLEYIEEVHFE